MDNMNDSRLWAQGSTKYEQLKVVVDINHYMLWAQASTCYEKLKVVNDINDSAS